MLLGIGRNHSFVFWSVPYFRLEIKYPFPIPDLILTRIYNSSKIPYSGIKLSVFNSFCLYHLPSKTAEAQSHSGSIIHDDTSQAVEVCFEQA